jgi:PadR family transcriptional regulator, regulatory protein PadR
MEVVMDFSQDLVKGSIVPIVLALLRERPMYGYEIVKLVNARSGGVLRWKEGTLYPTLHGLEGEGLVRSYWEQADDSARRRKYYAITRSGTAELKRRAGEWQAFSSAVNSVLSSTLSGGPVS